MNDDREPSAPDLRPVIARLREIERRCAAMGSRNEEFPLTQQRVASIIARLEAGQEPSGEKLHFGRIARELFPVAHLFESVGFMSVGREIAHIERALREFDPEADDGAPVPSPMVQQVSSAAAVRPSEDTAPETVDEPTTPSRSVPMPVVIALLLLATAAAVAASIVLGIGPAARLAGRTRALPPSPTATPAPTPSPSPAPVLEPSPTALSMAAGESAPRARLAAAVSQARLALARGDFDGALGQLTAAALVDRTDEDVVEIADVLVNHFVARAGEAADKGEWEEAAARLERAERLAMRFGLDEVRIEQMERRIAEMERYRFISPRDTRALRAAVGQRVDVILRDGRVRSGRIDTVGADTLVLDVVRELGGGGLLYTEELALAEVRTIKLYDP
jgi:hypothetical protein